MRGMSSDLRMTGEVWYVSLWGGYGACSGYVIYTDSASSSTHIGPVIVHRSSRSSSTSS